MKKMIVMAAMMMATVMTANAQARFEAGRLTLQPRTGGTGALFTNVPDLKRPDGREIEKKATGGAFVGVDLEYYLTNRISFAAGVNWFEAGTGWKDFDYMDGSVNMKVKETAVKTDYIGIPLTVNWYVVKGLAVKTGVQMAFLVSAKNYVRTEYSKGDVDYTLTEEESVKSDMKKFDLSIPVGLSYEFKVPLVIDARYNIGLTKVNKDGDEDMRNSVFTITLGYKFKL